MKCERSLIMLSTAHLMLRLWFLSLWKIRNKGPFLPGVLVCFIFSFIIMILHKVEGQEKGGWREAAPLKVFISPWLWIYKVTLKGNRQEVSVCFCSLSSLCWNFEDSEQLIRPSRHQHSLFYSKLFDNIMFSKISGLFWWRTPMTS